MTNKEKARAYHQAVSAYDEATIAVMLREDYIQHNPAVPTGRAAFVSFLSQLKKHGTKIENVRMLQDGPYIIMHHTWKNAIPFGKNETAAFHIIRFDEAGLIAEHWNVMTEKTPSNPSGRSLVDGETEIKDLDQTAKNKAKIIELFSHWTAGKRNDLKDLLRRFFQADFHQHHPMTADGVDTLAKAHAVEFHRQHKVFGEGNFVLSISEGISLGNPVVSYDLFRLENGMIAEHWSITQEIPKENLANENTMFGFEQENRPVAM